MKVVWLCNAVGALCPGVLWLHSSGWMTLSPISCLLVLLAWGAAWALPFYVPPGLLALDLGGKAHSALVTNLFEGAGFLAAAVFSKFAVQHGRAGQWGPVMQTLFIGGVVATWSMHAAMSMLVRDSKRD